MLALILILHFALGAALVAAGDRVNRRGFALAMIAPLSTVAWLAPRLGDIVSDVDGGKTYSQAISWVPGLDLAIDFRVDAFSSVMLLLISGIGLAVCTYALGYFSAPKAGVGALSGLLTMFAGAMTGLVVSDHLLALFIFWELTSVTSYALIGNDDRNPKARDAALQAVLITGAGGLAMLAGLVIIGQSAGTFRLWSSPRCSQLSLHRVHCCRLRPCSFCLAHSQSQLSGRSRDGCRGQWLLRRQFRHTCMPQRW